MWSTVGQLFPLLLALLSSGDGAQVPLSFTNRGSDGTASYYGDEATNGKLGAMVHNSKLIPPAVGNVPLEPPAEFELEATPQPDNDNPVEMELTTSHPWKRSSKAKDEQADATAEKERKKGDEKQKKGKKKTKVAGKNNAKEDAATTKKPRPKSGKAKQKPMTTAKEPDNEKNTEKKSKDIDSEKTESGVQTIKHVVAAFKKKNKPIPEEVEMEADKLLGRTEKKNGSTAKGTQKPKPQAQDKGQGKRVHAAKPKAKANAKSKPKEKGKAGANGNPKGKPKSKLPPKVEKNGTEEKKSESKPKPKVKAKGTGRPKAKAKPKPESKKEDAVKEIPKPKPKGGSRAKTKATAKSKRSVDIPNTNFELLKSSPFSSDSGSLKKSPGQHRVKRDSRVTNTASFFANLPRIQFANTRRMGRIRSVDDNAIAQEAKTVPPYLFRPHEQYLEQPFHFDMRVMSIYQESGDENNGLGFVHNRVKRFGQPSTKALYRHRPELFHPSGKKATKRSKRSLGSEFLPLNVLLNICFDLVQGRCLNITSLVWRQAKHSFDLLKQDMLSVLNDSGNDKYTVISERLSRQMHKCHSSVPQQLTQDYHVPWNGYSPLALPEMYPDFIGSNEIDTGEPLVRLKRLKRQSMNALDTVDTAKYDANTAPDNLLQTAGTLLFKNVRRICSDYFMDPNPTTLEIQLNQLFRMNLIDVSRHDLSTPEYKMAINILQTCLIK